MEERDDEELHDSTNFGTSIWQGTHGLSSGSFVKVLEKSKKINKNPPTSWYNGFYKGADTDCSRALGGSIGPP